MIRLTAAGTNGSTGHVDYDERVSDVLTFANGIGRRAAVRFALLGSRATSSGYRPALAPATFHLRVPSDPLHPPQPFPVPEPIPAPGREPAPDGPETPDVPLPGPDPIGPSQI